MGVEQLEAQLTKIRDDVRQQLLPYRTVGAQVLIGNNKLTKIIDEAITQAAVAVIDDVSSQVNEPSK